MRNKLKVFCGGGCWEEINPTKIILAKKGYDIKLMNALKKGDADEVKAMIDRGEVWITSDFEKVYDKDEPGLMERALLHRANK